jgi:hypothetical protein
MFSKKHKEKGPKGFSFKLSKKMIFALSAIVALMAIYAVYQSLAAEYVANQKLIENFSINSRVSEKSTPEQSNNPHWWAKSGGEMIISNGTGKTIQGNLKKNNYWAKVYSKSNPVDTNNGQQPQNVFMALTRSEWTNGEYQTYFKSNRYNAINSPNRTSESGMALLARYTDDNNYYRVGFSADGNIILIKRVNGTNYTLSKNTYFAGNYTETSSLIPRGYWYGIRAVFENVSSTSVKISVYADKTGGQWQLVNELIDSGTLGKPIVSKGLAGIKTDFMDAEFDGFQILTNQQVTVPAPTPDEGTKTGPAPEPTPDTTSFDVTSYGAKANDGIDDSAAFAKAISASIGNGRVYVPSGTFNVQNIKVPANAIISMSATAVLSYSGSFGGYVLRLEGDGIKVTGGTLDVRYQGGVILARGSNMNISKLTANNSYGKVGGSNYNAIDYVGKNTIFDGITVNNSWEGIVISSNSSGVTVKNSKFYVMTREAILVYGSNNVRVEDCVIDTFGTGDIFRGGIHFYGAQNVIALRNRVLNGGKDSSGIRLRDTNGFTIEYNNIYNVGETGIGVVQQNDWPGITSGNGVIAYNTIEKTGLRGIGHPYTNLASIKVQNNNIKNIYYNSSTTTTIDSADCIIVLQSGSEVSGNRVENCGGFGIRTGSGVTSFNNTQINVGRY